jgi:hypothetical protein
MTLISTGGLLQVKEPCTNAIKQLTWNLLKKEADFDFYYPSQ